MGPEETRLRLPLAEAGLPGGEFRDLLSGRIFPASGDTLSLTLPPYGRLWLKWRGGRREGDVHLDIVMSPESDIRMDVPSLCFGLLHLI